MTHGGRENEYEVDELSPETVSKNQKYNVDPGLNGRVLQLSQ